MTENCKLKLEKMKVSGTKKQSKMAASLLGFENKKGFSNISEFCELLESKPTSSWRFASMLGFPSFKHFVMEYNAEPSTIVQAPIAKVDEFREENFDLLKKISKSIKGRIFIITSRRAKSLGKFIMERLNDAEIACEYNYESKDDLDEFMSKITKDDTIFLITLSSYSYKIDSVSKSIKEIEGDPTVVLFTHNHEIKHPVEFFVVHSNDTYGSLESLDDWSLYNNACLSLMTSLVTLLDFVYKNIKEK